MICVQLTIADYICVFMFGDYISMFYSSRSYMMEKLERNVVSWEIQHIKVESMAYVSAVCFDERTVI